MGRQTVYAKGLRTCRCAGVVYSGEQRAIGFQAYQIHGGDWCIGHLLVITLYKYAFRQHDIQSWALLPCLSAVIGAGEQIVAMWWIRKNLLGNAEMPGFVAYRRLYSHCVWIKIGISRLAPVLAAVAALPQV